MWSDGSQCHRPLKRLNQSIRKWKLSNNKFKLQAFHIPSHIDSKMKMSEVVVNRTIAALEPLKNKFGGIDWIINGNEAADKLAVNASNHQGKLPGHLDGNLPVELAVTSKKRETYPCPREDP